MRILLIPAGIALGLLLVLAGAGYQRSASSAETPAALEKVLPQPSGDELADERAVLDLLARRPGGKEEALALIRTWIAAPGLNPTQEQQFQNLIQAFREDEAVEKLVAETVGSAKESRPGRLLLLRVLARSWVEPSLSWRSALGKAIQQEDLVVSREAVATVKARQLTECDAALRALASRSSAPAELRIAALETLAPRQRLSADDVALLGKEMRAAIDPLLTLMSARALGATRLDNKQLLQLSADFPNLTPTAGLSLLPAFARTRNSEVGISLMNRLRASPTAQLLGVGDLDRLLALYPTDVVEAAGPLRKDLLTRSRRQREVLAKAVANLPPGDEQRGQQIFFAAKANCSTCHRAEGKGGTVGPNLSRIGVIRGRQELLESIVWPSAYVAPEFRAYAVTTADGGIFAGILVQETSDALYLRGGEKPARRIPKDHIEDIALSPTSLMPEGFEKLLTPQELSDLAEYLAQRR